MECKKCKTDLFKIQIKDCEGCEYNGAYTKHDGYIYDSERIEKENLERNESYDNGQCLHGSCWDAGCYMFECNNCGSKTNLGILEE